MYGWKTVDAICSIKIIMLTNPPIKLTNHLLTPSAAPSNFVCSYVKILCHYYLKHCYQKVLCVDLPEKKNVLNMYKPKRKLDRWKGKTHEKKPQNLQIRLAHFANKPKIQMTHLSVFKSSLETIQVKANVDEVLSNGKL